MFGKANTVAAAPDAASPEYTTTIQQLLPPGAVSRDKTVEQFAENQQRARLLAWSALLEILVFFGVLLVGFAYLWHRGDLAWVRSLAAERPTAETTTPAAAPASVQPAPGPLAGTGIPS